MPSADSLSHYVGQYASTSSKSLTHFAEFILETLKDNNKTPEDLPEPYLSGVFQIAFRSDYVRETLVRYPELFLAWASPDSCLYKARLAGDMEHELANRLESATDEAALLKVLRDFRQQEMMRVIWRDLSGLSDLYNTMAEVSNLADVCISVTLSHLFREAVQRSGMPRSLNGEPQEMLVLGMGKLGARELNVSSDIDLIFAYPEPGETDHPKKPVDNHRFFTRLGQKLIQALDQVTGEGFVFRVDMRLRPYGSAGALALNFSAFEDYYQNQGREWERFAMVKARVITGSKNNVESLQDIILPFVYRRYTDFSLFQALREMKRLIQSEVHRKGGEQNIKLGAGGIREIEFIVQACQLIHGGRDHSLQQPGLLSVLPILKEQEYLPAEWVDDLFQANAFLRDLEHAIQGRNDKQTQLLPALAEEQIQVAASLGFESWAALEQVLDKHRDKVSQLFGAFLEEAPEQEEKDREYGGSWLHLWQASTDKETWLTELEREGFESPESCWQALEDLRNSRLYRTMSADASKRLDRFLPLLLKLSSEQAFPSVSFVRIMGLVRSILGRTIYLVLLYENPEALRALCRLCQESPWIAEHLAKSPVILDELLDASALYQPPPTENLKDELRQSLLRIPLDDLEAQMDALRHFKQSHMLRVAAAELTSKMPLMKVSDYLTWLAEALVQKCVDLAWLNLVQKHGVPSGIHSDSHHKGFAVIAYGKLGGIELNYHSDLDMVFLYQCDENGMTQGPRSINNQLFYTRLGQRVIHFLTTNTTQGDLYEVDMRLRPSGNSGMLVASIPAFERYQAHDAWTWEHQAIVRARFIAGDLDLGVEFDRIRAKVLSEQRDETSLKEEVRSMRDKMKLAAKDKFKDSATASLDIKLGDGGLVDIEFITQLGVLLFACEHSELLQWTDNVRLLETLHEESCFPGVSLLPLIEAYKSLRAAQHRKNLADESYHADLSNFADEARLVQKAWKRIFDGAGEIDSRSEP